MKQNIKKRMLLISGLIILMLILIRAFVGDASPRISYLKPDTKLGSNQLVVVLHAFTNSRDDMQDVIKVIEDVYPDADISAPNYHSSVLSNANLFDTAAQLDLGIQELVDQKKLSGSGYDEIILVGHSIGALLARKTYLYGSGYIADHPLGKRVTQPQEWSGLVTRVVLLAGMNRGWSEENMGGLGRLKTFAGSMFNKLTGQGEMVMSVRRGAPFVANLKLDWIRLVNSEDPMPQVIQLLGDNDKVAPEGDHQELMASPNFVFIPVLGTKHGDIIEMGNPRSIRSADNGDPDQLVRDRRKTAFIKALNAPIDELHREYGSRSDFLDSKDPNRMNIEHVVFVMHGIRDYGEWVPRLAHSLEQQSSTIRAISSKYGYFPMARFLMFSDREENVRWFVDKYAEALSLYPNASTMSFVGHSNGTYLLASALENYKAINFDRVYFAGSVVRTDFPWDEFIPGRVHVVRNDLASGDWVVAWFPKLFQIVRKQFDLKPTGFFNIGSAGFDGFESGSVNKNQITVIGGHGAALENESSIIDFVINEGLGDLPDQAEEKSEVIGFLSNIPWLVWFLLIILIVGGALLFTRLKPIRNRLGKVNAYIVYSLLIIVIIYTI